MPQLIWDITEYRICASQLTIAISPENLPPFNVSAIVEEMDTDLILNDKPYINSEEKPLWYLANKLSANTSIPVGTIRVCRTVPVRLQAIIHDLDKEPTWQATWIGTAIHNLFTTLKEQNINSIQLPILGTKFGNIKTETFVKALSLYINSRSADFQSVHSSPVQIWLSVPGSMCADVYRLLKEQLIS